MRSFLSMLIGLVFCHAAQAQAPAEDALQSAQRKAGAAFSDLKKTEFETARAEKEFRRVDADHKNAQKRADDMKRKSEAANKDFEAAKAKEAAARKSYDAAVEVVDKIARPAGKK
jgi:chromosome segregation ATPase